MKKYFYLLLRIVIVAIFAQTLRYKFIAHPDSVYIFKLVNMEPYGRLLIGILEVIASVLILVPRTIWLGALMSIGLMLGAIFLHLTKIGIVVNNDGGGLFFMAVMVLLLSVLLLWRYRRDLTVVKERAEHLINKK